MQDSKDELHAAPVLQSRHRADANVYSGAFLEYQDAWARRIAKLWRDAPRTPYALLQGVRQKSVEDLPPCDWQKGDPKIQSWKAKAAKKFDAFLGTLKEVDIITKLVGGTLLGAIRHHGTIPYDEDMDMGFDACQHMHVLEKSQSFKGLGCDALKAQLKKDPRDFNQRMWDDVLKPLLGPKGIVKVETTSYGLRLSNGQRTWRGGLESGAGVGVDFVLDAFSSDRDNDLCKCVYGNTLAGCSASPWGYMKEWYGDDYMEKPLGQCKYYENYGHPEWAWRSSEECGWADKVLSESAGSARVREGQKPGQLEP